uniref:URF603 n=1 Tax=Marchantia polymorpha TaxID=3197 RepID=Q32615_MARPO|nr:URF603 [Marchantia polymorpha]prf//1111187C URF 603 [Marchantia polymorpha]
MAIRLYRLIRQARVTDLYLNLMK